MESVGIIQLYKEKPFAALEDHIGIVFRAKEYLVQSFVHRSYLNENRSFPLAHNERLEFLGDAVLELIVTEFLVEHYLNPESNLTSWRAALVNAKMCAQVANEIGLDQYLFLSHGESKDAGTKAREIILANAIEALIGAIYVDQGWDMAKQFVTRWVLSKLPIVLEFQLWADPKSKFQEAAQEIMGTTPTYRVLEEAGPDHSKQFLVGVYLERDLVATGKGTSKQEAQIAAAEKGLEKKGWKGPKIDIIQRLPGGAFG
jgi:ribonuclease III